MKLCCAQQSLIPILLKIDDALNALSKFDPRKARVVELRYFGAEPEETRRCLKISPTR